MKKRKDPTCLDATLDLLKLLEDAEFSPREAGVLLTSAHALLCATNGFDKSIYEELLKTRIERYPHMMQTAKELKRAHELEND